MGEAGLKRGMGGQIMPFVRKLAVLGEVAEGMGFEPTRRVIPV